MSSIVIGILAVAIGLLFCLRGVVAMRIVIAVWGAFVGLNLGAGIVSALSGDGFLSTALGWIVGILVAVGVVHLVAAHALAQNGELRVNGRVVVVSERGALTHFRLQRRQSGDFGVDLVFGLALAHVHS